MINAYMKRPIKQVGYSKLFIPTEYVKLMDLIIHKLYANHVCSLNTVKKGNCKSISIDSNFDMQREMIDGVASLTLWQA